MNIQELINQANGFVREGKFQEAVDCLERVDCDEVNDLVVRLNIGMIFKENDDFAEARGHFAFCVEINPDDHNSLAELGYCLTELGDFETAEGCLKGAIARVTGATTTHTLYHYYLGRCYEKWGFYEEARGVYEIAAREDGTFEFQEALERVRMHIEDNPWLRGERVESAFDPDDEAYTDGYDSRFRETLLGDDDDESDWGAGYDAPAFE